jgi:hypothetical protein
MSETNFIDLQNLVATRIKADGYFAGIPVITDKEPDISSQIQTALSVTNPAGNLSGACVIVMQPFANDFQSDLPGGPLSHLVSILCLEHLILNRDGTRGTGKSVRAMAERLHKLFKHFTAHGMFSNFVCQEPFIVDASEEIARALQDDMLRGVEVRFGTRGFGPEVYQKAALPVITEAGGTVSISCATEGAAILYTTDGSVPDFPERNAGVEVYSDPFVPLVTCTVRAGAWVLSGNPVNLNPSSDWIASDIASLPVTVP